MIRNDPLVVIDLSIVRLSLLQPTTTTIPQSKMMNRYALSQPEVNTGKARN